MKKIFKVSLITLSVLAVALTCCIFTALAVSNDGGAMPVADRVAGDVDGDGSLTVKDVILLSRAIANHDYDSTEPLKVDGGDYNGDGVVDLFDLNAMRSFFSNQDFYDSDVAEQGLLDLKHTLRVNADGSFKVLILSDVQCYNAEGIKNTGTYDAIEAMLDAEDPDLVLFLGDNSWSCNTAAKMREYISVMVKPVEDRKIPWAHVYGNHDAENNEPHYTAISKEEQQAIYEEFAYCVSKSGLDELSGVGNYVLPVLEHSGDKIAFNVWALDSLMYNYPRPNKSMVVNKGTSLQNNFPYDYEGLTEAQVKWYEETSALLEKYNGGEKIPAMMYFHIPLQESYYAWADAVSGGTLGATNLIGQKAENISAPAYNSGLFDAIVKRGDVKVVANGHDHVNDFSVDYKGVTLAYSGSIGLQEYGDYDIIGARVVDFSNGEVSTHMSYLKDIPAYDNENPIINMEITESGVTNAAKDRYELSNKGNTASNSIAYNDELGRYVVNFVGSSSNPGVFNYPAADLTPIIYDGFSYEIAFKVDSVNFSTNYVGILDLEEEGGFGLNVYKNGSSTDTYILKAEVSTGPLKTSGWQSDTVTLEVGKWYHVVYSYNWVSKTERTTALYVDGVKVAGVTLSGMNSKLYRKPNFATNPGVEDFLCIGGCAQHKTNGVSGFSGAIAICNLLPTSTDADTAKALSDTFRRVESERTPILDLQINSDGSVVNAAEGRPQLNSFNQSGTKEVVNDATLGKNVISFVGNATRPSTYTLHTKEFNSAFSDGFSYEIMFKVDNTDFSSSYVGILDMEEGGGFGLDVYKSTTAGKYKIYAEVATGSSWTKDIVELDLGVWYHAVYVYSGSSTALYINGQLVSSQSGISGSYRTPNFGSCEPYLCIGGCAQVANVNPPADPNAGANGFTGAIADTNIFLDPMSADEALALYNAAIAK